MNIEVSAECATTAVPAALAAPNDAECAAAENAAHTTAGNLEDIMNSEGTEVTTDGSARGGSAAMGEVDAASSGGTTDSGTCKLLEKIDVSATQPESCPSTVASTGERRSLEALLQQEAALQDLLMPPARLTSHLAELRKERQHLDGRWAAWRAARSGAEQSKREALDAEMASAMRRLQAAFATQPNQVYLRAGCRARLRALSQMPHLNGEEVSVVRWFRPSSRWVVRRVASSTSEWPCGSTISVAADKLEIITIGLHSRLGADPVLRVALLERVLQRCTLADAARAAAVDKTFSSASVPTLRRKCVANFTRSVPLASACVELSDACAPSILPLLTKQLEQLEQDVKPYGGSINAFVCAGPILHVAQAKDLSCSYRSLQMVISHMIAQDERLWPGARETFLDDVDSRRSHLAIPSVARLQRSVVTAWRSGYDPVGAEQLEYATFHNGEAAPGMPVFRPSAPAASQLAGARDRVSRHCASTCTNGCSNNSGTGNGTCDESKSPAMLPRAVRASWWQSSADGGVVPQLLREWRGMSHAS